MTTNRKSTIYARVSTEEQMNTKHLDGLAVLWSVYWTVSLLGGTFGLWAIGKWGMFLPVRYKTNDIITLWARGFLEALAIIASCLGIVLVAIIIKYLVKYFKFKYIKAAASGLVDFYYHEDYPEVDEDD